MTIIDVVMAIFVAIFTIAAAISLLDMIGLVTIRDADQRKWLFRSLIGAVVLAVASFGARQFGLTREQSTFAALATPTSAPASPIARPIAAPGGRATPLPPTPGRNPVQPPDVAAEAATCPTDATVQLWADERLGSRPLIPAAFDRDYPACVASLRAAVSIDDDAATACRAALEVHKGNFISPYFAAKIEYDMRLKREERALRQGGVTDEELPRYNHVLCENESYNFDGGKDLERLTAAESRINDDIRSCRSRACR